MHFLEDYFNIFTKYLGSKSKNGQSMRLPGGIYKIFTENGKLPLAFFQVYDMIV